MIKIELKELNVIQEMAAELVEAINNERNSIDKEYEEDFIEEWSKPIKFFGLVLRKPRIWTGTHDQLKDKILCSILAEDRFLGEDYPSSEYYRELNIANHLLDLDLDLVENVQIDSNCYHYFFDLYNKLIKNARTT